MAITATVMPTSVVVAASVREKMSPPVASVPNRWAAFGAAEKPPVAWASGG